MVCRLDRVVVGLWIQCVLTHHANDAMLCAVEGENLWCVI